MTDDAGWKSRIQQDTSRPWGMEIVLRYGDPPQKHHDCPDPLEHAALEYFNRVLREKANAESRALHLLLTKTGMLP